MSIKLSIRSQFDFILELTNYLIEEIQQLSISHASYFQLPPVLAQDENESRNYIPVTVFSDENAIPFIQKAYLDVFKNHDISGRVLTRHPGILAVNTDNPDALIERINQINKAKVDFKNLILGLGNNDARFNAVHEAIPNVITLAVYRQIHYEKNSPYSIRFTWMHKHSVKTFSKQQALELLNNSEHFGCINKINEDAWRALVNQEQLRVAALPDKQLLRIRRPTPVSPQVNIRFSATNRYHVSAALPFIVINPDPELKLGTLPDYNKPLQHPRKLEKDFLVERLYLETVNR
ncbi:DNA replication terminus site-binding protein [Pseudoalteromonas tunicata]|uniref:DNA replication terminus site-binding protein n=1 Tax=Pseudoalteromonas tunicata TaxID=314281 RepID=UPI00273E903C|nr:DNA replication terminus site-binding protein [Pseudoalteromonas tunicata]MDP4982598.1 DNA replication terminus site-binding protein [Pseudoalteromonas tunicata]